MKKENWYKILGVITILTFLFGSGVVYRFCSESEEHNKNDISSEHNSLSESNNLSPIVLKNNIPYSIKMELGELKKFNWEGEEITINFKEFSKSKKSNFLSADTVDAVVMKFNVGGGLVYGGELTTEVYVNEYLMIEKQNPEEELYSVYQYITSSEYFSFFRIYVEHINKFNKTIQLNLFFTKKYM